MQPGRPLYLCAGLQSSGSTIVAWCFLQRPDMDGVLDARNDVLPEIADIRAPNVFCKITTSSFRLTELTGHYADEGWDVRPFLVVRDVRAVFNSLLSKHYGSNGTTAEEPPLRMRLRRFKEDWLAARERGWPLIRYESLVLEPEPTLRRACADLQLPWHDEMLTWPKGREDMAAPAHGSPTFRQSRGESLHATLKPEMAQLKTANVPSDDLDWMEREFAEFNRAFDYAEHAPASQRIGAAATEPRCVPRFENTRRYRKSQRPLARLQQWAAQWTGAGRARSTARGE
jgi:hypothetical protein